MDYNVIIIPNNLNFLEEVKKVYDKIIENKSDNLCLLNSKIFLPTSRACNILKNIFIKNTINNAIIPEIISPLNMANMSNVSLDEDFKCISNIIYIINKYDTNMSFIAKYNLATKIYNFINSLALEKLKFNEIISKLNYDNKLMIDIINEAIVSTKIIEETENRFIYLASYIKKISNYKSPTIIAGFAYSHAYLMDFLKEAIKHESVVFVQQENDNSYNLFDKYIKYLNINLSKIQYLEKQNRNQLFPLNESKNIYEEARDVALFVKYNLDKGKRVLLISLDKFFNSILKKYLNEWNIIPDDSAGIQFNETKTYKIFILIIECFIDNFSLISVISLLHVICQNDELLLEFELFCRQRIAVPQNFRNIFLEFISTNKNIYISPIYEVLIKYIEKYIRFNQKLKVNCEIIKLHFEAYFELIHHLKNDINYLEYIDKLNKILLSFIETNPNMTLNGYKLLVELLCKEIFIRLPFGYTPNILLLPPMEANFVQSDVFIVCEYNESSWNVDNDYFLLTENQKREINLNWNDRRNANISNALKRLVNQSNEIYFFRAEFKMNQKQEICKILDISNLTIKNDFKQILNLLNENLRDNFFKKNQYINKNLEKTLGKNPKNNVINSLSVSDIDRLVNKPYEFYATKYLKLKNLPKLDNSNNISLIKGNIIHKTIEYIDKKYQNISNIVVKNIFKSYILYLINSLEIKLNLLGDWILKLDSIVDFWQQNSISALSSKNEEKGNIFIKLSNGNMLNIKCIADKIQVNLNKELFIIDYKTGSTYNIQDVINFIHPQLLIEGMIAIKGGFKNFQSLKINDLIIVQLGGTKSSLNKISLKNTSKKELVQLILDGETQLQDVLEKYFVNYHDFTPIEGSYYTAYDHLSRIKELI